MKTNTEQASWGQRLHGVWPERHAGILWDPQSLVQRRVIENVPEPSYGLPISLRLIRNHMLDGRNANARNMSLLRGNADCMEGEWTSSRTRATVVASGRLCVGAIHH
jgi:hypothetical protein